MRKKLIVSVVALSYVLTCTASNVSVTFYPQPPKVTLGTNVVLNNISLTTQDAQLDHSDLVWILDYVPKMRFSTITDTNGDGPGYCYCGRLQDFSLFSNWKLLDEQNNVVGIGYVILPSYPTTMMARIVFTNVVLSWDTNQTTRISISAILSSNLSSDALIGFVSGDKIGMFLSKPDLRIYSGNDKASIIFNNSMPTDHMIIDRHLYSTIASIIPVGDDLIITAYVEPNKSFMLQTCDDLGDRSPFRWFYGGGESVLSSKYGEIFFSVPKPQEAGQQRYFRLLGLENPDSMELVQLDIVLPENAGGPIFPRAGIIQIGSTVKAPENLHANEYHWLADNGETGSNPTFAPTFTAGVHWVKLLVRGAATDAPTFKWIIVRP